MKNKKILISIMAVTIMIIYTFVLYNVMFTPQKMFNKAINKITDKINENTLNLNFTKAMTDINFKFNTNAADLKKFANYTYGLKMGTDSKNKTFETKIYMLDQANKEYSYTGYIKNSNLYHKLSTLDKLILYNIKDQDLTSFFENTEDINTEDIKYLINASAKNISKNFNKKYFSKEKSTVTINNKNIKVTKNTYSADTNEIKRLYKSLYNDSKTSKIITSMTNMTKEENQKQIDLILNTLNNEKIIFNVYSKFNKILGFDIYVNNENIISYYKKNDDFEINYDNYNITGIKKNKNLEVTIKTNNDILASLVFSKYQSDDFAFDYSTEMYIGKVSYKREKNKDNYKANLNITLNDGRNNYSFDINASQDSKSKIANINTESAEKFTEEEFSEALINFVTSLKDTPLSFLNDLFVPNYDETKYSNYKYYIN